ncbi:MAG: HD domain-containing protein, partial [Oscillospiraceae bacterium]|nr:HD domain-containing protein [Oscillospiraceae bacterium]
ASVIQLFVYGLSVTNISMVCVSILIYISALYDRDNKILRLNKLEIEFLQEERKSMHRLFDQTASAFVNAIEERSDSTAGHSRRVAEYAEMIARAIGKNEKDCEEIYFAGLLHEVGKIGIPESIIGKKGKLESDEQKVLEQIPVIGDRILSGITEYPFLCSAARSVNERYDGLGYPDGLSGEDIPEAARIVAVADHYATMTSVQYDRSPYPQLAVREELIENSGTIFDPRFARIMVNLIDSDPEYLMQDKDKEANIKPETEITSDAYRSKISRGILIEHTLTEISFTCRPVSDKNEFSSPSFIIFDSYDRRTHFDEESIRIFNYLEYGEIWPDGHIICTAARNMESDVTEKEADGENEGGNETYHITAGRFEDHARIVIEKGTRKVTVTAALQDSSKYAYIGITGENCHIENIKTEKTNTELQPGDIPRIAPKVVYTDRLAGDIPNIQIDSTRSETTEGILIDGRLKVEFHAMSLPSSRQTWHCPYIILFYSEDGRVNGPDYHEYTVIKLNGEISGDDDLTFNSLELNKEDFGGWENWRQRSMEGAECTALFRIKNGTVITTVTYAGLSIENATDIYDFPDKLYVALSGDQCALTDIRIH